MVAVILLDVLYAAAIAVSPTPIIVVMLILFSGTARKSAIFYFVGWIIGLVIIATFFFWLTERGLVLATTNSSLLRALLPLVLGIGLLLLARWQWSRIPKNGEDTTPPRWRATLDSIVGKSSEHVTPGRALALGVVMSAASPKNIAMIIALSIVMVEANLYLADQVLLLAFFIIVASIGIGIPVLYAAFKGEQADERLRQWRSWIESNTSKFAALFVGFVGVIMIVKSLVELFERFTTG